MESQQKPETRRQRPNRWEAEVANMYKFPSLQSSSVNHPTPMKVLDDSQSLDECSIVDKNHILLNSSSRLSAGTQRELHIPRSSARVSSPSRAKGAPSSKLEEASEMPIRLRRSPSTISDDHQVGAYCEIGDLFEQRTRFIRFWTDCFGFGKLVVVVYLLLYFEQWATLGEIFVLALALVHLASSYYLIKVWLQGKLELLMITMCLDILFLNLLVAAFMNDEHDIILEEETMADFIYHNFVIAMPVIYLLLIQSIMVTLEHIQTKRQRRTFFGVFIFTYVLQFFLPIKVKAGEAYEHFDFLYQVVVPALLLIAMCGMTYIFFRLTNFSATIFLKEKDEANRYKYMIHSLKDLVIVERGGEVIFKNKPAQAIFRRVLRAQESELGQEAILDLPLFLAFQVTAKRGGDDNGESEKSESRLSLRQLLESKSPSWVNSSIFTTSVDIGKSGSLDQLQQIIERLQKDESQTELPLFVQINLIRVKKEFIEDVYEGADEFMIQIQDVSQRILHQNLKIERQYLATMNSTVSHEMRNPLNALLASVEIQEQNLKTLVGRLDKIKQEEACPPSLSQAFQKSLKVSKSSCKLLKFNVEDILALPQIQQGKFSRNLSSVNLANTVQDIMDIMEFQVREKQIEADFVFSGFPSKFVHGAPCRDLEVQIDEQRFQQVLLNFFSNAIKFTKRHHRIRILLQFVKKYEPAHSEFFAQTSKFYRKHAPFDGESEDESEDSDADEATAKKKQAMCSSEKQNYRSLQSKALDKMLVGEDSDKLLLAVLDEGVGIKTQDQTKLFKLFGRVQATQKLNTKGVGLGLAISKMISEEFGGGVAIQSMFRTGSAFYSSMKINTDWGNSNTKFKTEDQAKLDERLGQIKKKQLARSFANLKAMDESKEEIAQGKKILIVDDEAYNCEVLKSLMTLIGVEPSRIDCCLGGQEALDKISNDGVGVLEATGGCNSCTYALVLTDLSMPFMDGYKFARKFRKMLEKDFAIPPAKQPRLGALTGHTESEFISQALESSIDQVFSKPISIDQIQILLTDVGFRVRIKASVRERIEQEEV